jgi:RNA polymerase sigma-70 factor (ECF subfamily)
MNVHPEMLTDDQLLEQFLQYEDRSAFATLVDRHRTGLINFIYRMNSNANDAEDLAQETFLKVYRSADKYGGNGKFRQWLFRIARNLFIDRYRRESRMKPVAPESMPEEIAHDAESGQREEVLTHLNKMSERDRSLLVLAHMENFSYDEIAETLGVSLKSVSVGLSRARGRFRKIVESHAKGEL